MSFSVRQWISGVFEKTPPDTLRLRQRRVKSYGWEEVLVPSVPCFGTVPEPWVARRRVPKKGSAAIRKATVYGGLFAVTSGGTLWQADECTRLPYFSANYSNYFLAKGGRYYLPIGHVSGNAASIPLC